MSRSRLSACLRPLVSRRWWWTTLLVIAGVAVMVRLGIWQLDRLEQRQAENAATRAQLAESTLNLNQVDPTQVTAGGPGYQQVTVSGAYDFAHQVLLVQQRYRGRLGHHLITPLRIEGSDLGVLVDRGWVAASDDGTPGWPDYAEPARATVRGYLRVTEAREEPGAPEISVNNPEAEWFRVDVAAIGAQLPYSIVDYFVLAAPEGDQGSPALAPPFREEPLFDLSNGPHLGYAFQWFTFSLLLSGGYIYYVCRNERERAADGRN